MILRQSYRDDLLDGLRGLPDKLFADHGKDKAAIMADNNIVEALWAHYQKSIEDYDVTPDYALRDALQDVCDIPMDGTAATKDEPHLKLVYVASPLSAPDEAGIKANMDYAKKASLFVIQEGHVPLAPHLLYPTFLDDNDPAQRAVGTQAAQELLSRCDTIWVFGKTISAGMRTEIDYADAHGIPIRYVKDF